MTELSNRALLVSLNISQWAARKLDKAETAAVTAKHGAADGAARVNKSLLPLADSLEKIHKATGVIRTAYYKHSLPWGGDNQRIIKASSYLDFTQMISALKADWQQAARTFVAEYPTLVDDARVLLGTLYRDDDYPHPSEIAAKFSLDITFMPVPSADDWRVSLADTEIDSLRKQITEKVAESQGMAMRDAWDRVRDVVQKAHDKLSQPEAVFRDSLIENIREMCAVMPSLNIADDPQLEAVRRELEGKFASIVPDQLRNSVTFREDTSHQMKDILDKMSALYGS